MRTNDGVAAIARGPFELTVNGTWFGEYSSAELVTQHFFSPKTLVDVSLGYRFADHFKLTGGIQNIGDTYPDQALRKCNGYRIQTEIPPGIPIAHGSLPVSRPAGCNRVSRGCGEPVSPAGGAESAERPGTGVTSHTGEAMS